MLSTCGIKDNRKLLFNIFKEIKQMLKKNYNFRHVDILVACPNVEKTAMNPSATGLIM